MNSTRLSLITLITLAMLAVPTWAEPAPASHPRLRPAPGPSTRPAVGKNELYLDAAKGNDANDGSEKSPWKTIAFALTRLKAGDTLYLRNGTYHEAVTISVQGKEDAPITIRSYPGELATIDGGMTEFETNPADAWEPVPDSKVGVFKSKKAYANQRDIIGAFGDSMVGLQTYWHRSDLESTNELWDEGPDGDILPLYCGPGIYYEPETGYIYARLSHTNLKGQAINYAGETDPRKLPLILSPFRTNALHVDQGRHLRFQDLVICGGGYETVVLDQAQDVTFDKVTVYCGTYGLRTSGTRHLVFYRSALYGNVPPWGYRTENSLRMRKGAHTRDIARLTGHALWTADAGLEYSVYAFPTNDDFEVSYSTFTDSHDGLYLGGINCKFHHNVLDGMQDDGMYVSPVFTYASGKLEIYQNRFSQVLTCFAFGGPITDVKNSSLLIYRNVIDLRDPVRTERPSTKLIEGNYRYGGVMGDHGSPPYETMAFYQNTVITAAAHRYGSFGLWGAGKVDYPRRILNNALVSLDKLPAYTAQTDPKIEIAGNLHWGEKMDQKMAATYFTNVKVPKNAATTQPYTAPVKSIAADPKFVNLQAGDVRPQPDSPLVNGGVDLPADLPDPLRAIDAGAPDIGALPLNAEPMKVGVEGAAK